MSADRDEAILRLIFPGCFTNDESSEKHQRLLDAEREAVLADWRLATPATRSRFDSRRLYGNERTAPRL